MDIAKITNEISISDEEGVAYILFIPKTDPKKHYHIRIDTEGEIKLADWLRKHFGER